MERQEATETSPLLAQSTTTLPDPALTPNSIPPSENEDEIEATAHRGGESKISEDEESHSISEDRAQQYQGLPEVRAKLRYIVPAIGIGVRPSPIRLLTL